MIPARRTIKTRIVKRKGSISIIRRRMRNEDEYRKEEWKYNDEFGVVHEFICDLILKQRVKLKYIRFGFSSHYSKIDCKNGIKIFSRYNKDRMNFPKMVFKVEDFEMEADQNSWEKIVVKDREIEVEAKSGALYFIFSKPIRRLFNNHIKKFAFEVGDEK